MMDAHLFYARTILIFFFEFFIKHLIFFCKQENVKAYEENTAKVDAMKEDDKCESNKRFRKQEEMSKTPEKKEQKLCTIRSRNKKVPTRYQD
jgi:hypothetical protein